MGQHTIIFRTERSHIAAEYKITKQCHTAVKHWNMWLFLTFCRQTIRGFVKGADEAALFFTVVKHEVSRTVPPREDGGWAASPQRKADRPVELQSNRPAQPAGPGIQSWFGFKSRAAAGPWCLHGSNRQKGKQADERSTESSMYARQCLECS